MPGESPVEVTTRSGSLRQPGPETHPELTEPATPTFAPEDAPQRAERRFPSDIPQGNRGVTRSMKSSPADAEDRPTMIGWIKGLRSEKRNPEAKDDEFLPPVSPAESPAAKPKPAMQDQSSSIDPRRVYRGPVAEEEIDESRYGSHFSETGVPDTGTDFRGREDSAF